MNHHITGKTKSQIWGGSVDFKRRIFYNYLLGDKKLILQNVLLKKEENQLLYIRETGNIKKEAGGLFFREGAKLSTNTYFNLFSISKWKKYCSLERVFLGLSVRGDFVLQVINSYRDGSGTISHVIMEKELHTFAQTELNFEVPDCPKGVVYFTLKALTEGSCLQMACYRGEGNALKKVKIALNICTFKREEYLKRNLEILKQNFFQGSDSVLGGQIEVFITDNGNTLDAVSMNGPGIHVFPNRNLGGTGGFTRGLLEIIKVKESLGITHVIFMDDDVEIEPESLVRTWAMVSLLKKEYRNGFIAGAMLRLDAKNIQHENGALWKEGKCRFWGRGLDLQNFSGVVRNEEECERDYAAWWYCCVPAGTVRPDNLPAPLFIHEDDVEYSLRNTKHIITLNGIAVWHEANEHRRVSSNEYYNLRNMLIVNALHCPKYTLGQVRRQVLTALLVALSRCRYKDMALIRWAVEDFCKGPKWLLSVDAAAYHQRIQEQGYSFEDVSALLKTAVMKTDTQRSSQEGFKYLASHAKTPGQIGRLILQVLSVNGYFLPPDKRLKAYYMNVHPVSLYRAGRLLLFDDKDRKGIVTERSVKQLFVMLKIYGRLLVLLQMRYKRSCRRYRAHFRKLRSADYWKKALQL